MINFLKGIFAVNQDPKETRRSAIIGFCKQNGVDVDAIPLKVFDKMADVVLQEIEAERMIKSVMEDKQLSMFDKANVITPECERAAYIIKEYLLNDTNDFNLKREWIKVQKRIKQNKINVYEIEKNDRLSFDLFFNDEIYLWILYSSGVISSWAIISLDIENNKNANTLHSEKELNTLSEGKIKGIARKLLKENKLKNLTVSLIVNSEKRRLINWILKGGISSFDAFYFKLELCFYLLL